jgi:hypothetical protein
VSVDTYLKRKKIDGYLRANVDDVKILMSRTMSAWAKTIWLDTKTFVLWKSFDVFVEPISAHSPGAT